MKNPVKVYLAILFGILLMPTLAAAQTGGQFAITQSVIAGGGANSAGGNLNVIGTNGQPSAGTNSTGGVFAVRGGFWQASLAPTAAPVSISGRVLTANGEGIRNARVSLANLPETVTQTALTGAFGYFSFSEIPAGDTYILTVQSKRYYFSNGTLVLSVMEDVSDLVFIADFNFP